MHGTGTPLGDPMEVAAGLAALRPASMDQSGRAPQRLALMASKSQAGHCEPAAGLVGLAAAVAAISNAAAAPVLHLRSLNPYVEAAMDGDGRASVARSTGGWADSRRLPPACSVSSFAFQGSNANAVIALPLNAGKLVVLAVRHGLCWRRERHWVLPEAHALLRTASIGSTGCLMFHAQAVSLRLCFLKDHQAWLTLHTCSLSSERGRSQVYILFAASA